ncbi:type II secretion system F family protein [Gordonia sp. PKS22-38]|uniref:Type II secretion system F family protein n=1 Tax=Gordonia prachuapensis TaxID=3115651 RepID=A0ABU7MWE9_9ACTN|nr:type II secretion system F family protein [Gordonia sp. PKS22-38]
MNTWTVSAATLIAVALWLLPGPAWTLHRVSAVPDPSQPAASSRSPDDPFAVASAIDLFAVCLRAGLPVGPAAALVAEAAPPGLARPLTVTADLLALGADADYAWRRFEATGAVEESARREDIDVERFDALATLARRSARAGSSLAGGLTELADGIRRQAHDDALAATERAGVAISAPLGLCFLPAFVCLGIVPVVLGLAGSVLGG